MRATRRIWGTALTAVAALLALTGCHGDGTDASAPVVRPVVTHTAAGPYAGLTARQVLDRSVAAMDAVPAVTINLRTTADGDTTVHFTGALTRSGRCAAAMVMDGYHIQVIRVGAKTYVKADTAFWRAKGGPHGDRMAVLLAGKWLVLPKAKSGSIGRMCDLHTILAMFSEGAGDGTLKRRSGTVTVAGQQAVTLVQTTSQDTTDILIAAHGTPYMLRAFTPDDSSNDVTFSGFGRAPHISAPPASHTLDVTAFGDPGISV